MIRTTAILLALVYSLLAAGVPGSLHPHHDTPAARRTAAFAPLPYKIHPHPTPHFPEPVCQLCLLLATPQVASTLVHLNLHPTGWVRLAPEAPLQQPPQTAQTLLRSRSPPAYA